MNTILDLLNRAIRRLVGRAEGFALASHDTQSVER